MLKRIVLSGSLLSLSLALAPVDGNAANWGNVLYDAQHSGKSPTAVGPSNPSIKWSYQHPSIFDPISGWTYDPSFNGGIVEGPDGTLYTGGNDNNSYALHPNGSVKHIFYGVGLCCGPPAIGPDGTIYFLGDGLYAFDPATYELKFHLAGPGGCCSGITAAQDGKVYVGSGTLYAVDTNNLKFVNDEFGNPTKEITSEWEGYYNDGWFAAVSPDGQTVYFADGVALMAINAADGVVKWTQNIVNPGVGAPTVSPAGIIYIADDQKIIAIDPSKIPANYTTPPVAAIRTIITTPGKQFTNISIDPTSYADGVTLVSAAYGFTIDPVDGVTRIPEVDGLIYAIKEAGGTAPIRWTQFVSGSSDNESSGPAIKLSIDKTGAIYTATRDKTPDGTDYAAHLYAFSATGTPIFEYFIPTTYGSDVRTVVLSNGTAYALIDGAVKAFGGAADLSVTTSATPSPVNTNGAFNYTSIVNSAGPDKATNVVFKQVFDKKLAGKLSITSVNPLPTDPTNGCSISGIVLTCNLDDFNTAGTPVTVTVAATAPAAPATLTTGASVDADEVDNYLSNNAVTVKTSVVAPLTCDLSVTAVGGPTAVTRGTTKYNFTATVKNNGTGTCAASTLGFYFSSNTTIDTTDTQIGTSAINALAAGASQSVTLSAAVATTKIAAGSFYIGAIGDYNLKVTETNETNNTKATTAKTTIK
jgi:hypothetical protein